MKRALCLLTMIVPLSLGATLPRTGPVPAAKPAEDAAPARPDSPPQQPGAAGTPPAREDTPPTGAEPGKGGEVPMPLPKPDEGGTPAAPTASDGQSAPDGTGQEKEQKEEKPAPEPPPPPLVQEDPEELKACVAELTALGGKFETHSRIDEGKGCGIEQPIDVTEVLPGVELGGATMRCKTALTMARWLKDTVQPALHIAMPGRRITRLMPGSTYECRLRNGASTGKISEHAHGNAFDVAGFRLDNGETIEMKPRDEDSTLEGAFQRTATAGACLHFTTVLSPGSDAAHQNHLHLDVMERDGGYRYCR